MDWSTSYMASASSSHSHGNPQHTGEESSTFDDSPDEDSSVRSRRLVEQTATPPSFSRNSSPTVSRNSGQHPPVATTDATQQNSPHIRTPSSMRHWSSHGVHHKIIINLLPKYYILNPSIPRFGAQVDIRKLLEHLILFFAISVALFQFSRSPYVVDELWIVRELGALTVASAVYMLATRTPVTPPHATPHVEQGHRRHTSPHVVNNTSPQKSLLWMTTAKDYRADADDGILTALLLGPVTAASMLYGSLISQFRDSHYPSGWIIEEPRYLQKSMNPLPPQQALLNGRRNLVQLSTLCAFVLLTHLCTSYISKSNRTNGSASNSETEKKMRQGWRTWSFIGYATVVSTVAVTFHIGCDVLGLEIWKDLSYFDVAVISSFYQFSVYVMIRLSHGGFTLGEVGLVSVGSTVLFMETLNVTIANMWPVTAAYIKTTRYPSPLLIFQLALVPGSLLVGFLLSPLLVLSRHISQLPAHRLKRQLDRAPNQPTNREAQRRALSLSFYFFAFIIVFGLIGFWTQWSLGGRNPWIWTVMWLTEGSTSWSRPAMLVYWALIGSFTVGTWSRQLARSRRFQRSNSTGIPLDPAFATDTIAAPPSPAPGSTFSHVATDILDAADKRVPTLSLNARRKSFHALALFMFLPGIILDPAFTHFCLSAAFALFVFAEYIRYFALYPFGRFIHIFLHEFVDSKDSGSAILSHFYLLTGFADSLWLEGPWRLLEYTGALSLGIGDAMASIVGRKMGRTRWTEGNPKTVEGSIAFLVTVLLANLVLRMFGAVEPFSIARYTCVLAIGCLLEAVSNQNDNLTIPLFIWSMTVFCNVVRT